MTFAQIMRPLLHQHKSNKSLSDLGFKSDDEIDVVGPNDLFARLMTLKMKLKPVLVETLRTSSCAVIGDVPEADEIHVVCRVSGTSSKGVKFSRVAVESAKLSGGEWRLLLSEEVAGQAQSVIPDGGSGR